jgi:hypothetical protein
MPAVFDASTRLSSVSKNSLARMPRSLPRDRDRHANTIKGRKVEQAKPI